jgi:hypothetical protein
MRVIVVLIFGSLLSGMVHGQLILEAPRSIAVDLDLDGELEVITGGRIGPYRSEGLQRGAVQVGKLRGGLVETVVDAVGMTVVRDVAIGDYQMDGCADVFSVGDGWLRAHRFESGRLLEVVALPLASDWTDRIAVLNRKSNSLVVVTEYDIRPDSDVGQTVVRAFETGTETLHEVWDMTISAHIGDLAFVGDGDTAHLIMETGTAEEGGDVLVYEVPGVARPSLVWSGRLTQGRRCLTIEATDPARDEVLLRSVDGDAAIYELGPQGLVLKRRLSLSTGSRVIPVSTTLSTVSGPRSPTFPPQVLFREAFGEPYRLTTF